MTLSLSTLIDPPYQEPDARVTRFVRVRHQLAMVPADINHLVPEQN